MRKIEKFYKNTENAQPNKNVTQFIQFQTKPGKAIEIGCGAGRDTTYLIKHKWNVLAIDKEDTESIISKKLSKEELKRFRFKQQEFKEIQLEKNNLIIANFCIPFCNKNNFNELWEKIKNSILPNRIFCWQFLWRK